jgi:hypothetical protein
VIIFDNKKDMKFSKDYHQLVSDFLDVMKPLDPTLELLEVKTALSGINRDIRFQKTNHLTSHILEFGSSGTKKVKVVLDIMFISKRAILLPVVLCPEADDLKVRKEIAFHED